MAVTPGGLCLLHFEPRYRHAGHYLGYADDIAARVAVHLACGPKASPLVRAAVASGSTVTLARTWPGEDRKRERRLKVQGGHSRKCPLCGVKPQSRARGRKPARAGAPA